MHQKVDVKCCAKMELAVYQIQSKHFVIAICRKKTARFFFKQIKHKTFHAAGPTVLISHVSQR